MAIGGDEAQAVVGTLAEGRVRSFIEGAAALGARPAADASPCGDEFTQFVKVKLNPVRELLAGKRVILIDDSIVRGTTSRKIVKMVRAAGAKEVHMRISCPPTLSPCFYGIDTPTKKELIASSHTVEEIGKYIEADSLGYLSLQGLIRAVGGKGNEFCTACYTGQYPIDFADMMMDAKAEDRQLDLWEASLKK